MGTFLQRGKAMMYDKRPKMERYPTKKLSFSQEKDCFFVGYLFIFCHFLPSGRIILLYLTKKNSWRTRHQLTTTNSMFRGYPAKAGIAWKILYFRHRLRNVLGCKSHYLVEGAAIKKFRLIALLNCAVF